MREPQEKSSGERDSDSVRNSSVTYVTLGRSARWPPRHAEGRPATGLANGGRGEIYSSLSSGSHAEEIAFSNPRFFLGDEGRRVGGMFLASAARVVLPHVAQESFKL